MAFIDEQMRREDNRVAIVQYKYFFDHVNLETTPFEFSEEVLEVCEDERLSLEDKQTVLTNPLRQHVELLTLDVLEKYVVEIQKDPVLLSMLFKYFSTLPVPCGPDLEIVLKANSEEIWTIRKMLCALQFISPEEMAFFATITKNRFRDSLPGWVRMKLTACQFAAPSQVSESVPEATSDPDPVPEGDVIVFMDRPRGNRASRHFARKALEAQSQNPGSLVRVR